MKKINIMLIFAFAMLLGVNLSMAQNRPFPYETGVPDHTVAPITQQDTAFVIAATTGGMAEIALGKLALEKSANSKIKAFANMMIKDHGKANEELKQLASAEQISLPVSLGGVELQTYDRLATKKAAEFDSTYVEQMVKDHINTIDLFQQASKTVTDAAIKQFIEKTLPVLHEHLEHVKDIQQEVQ